MQGGGKGIPERCARIDGDHERRIEPARRPRRRPEREREREGAQLQRAFEPARRQRGEEVPVQAVEAALEPAPGRRVEGVDDDVAIRHARSGGVGRAVSDLRPAFRIRSNGRSGTAPEIAAKMAVPELGPW